MLVSVAYAIASIVEDVSPRNDYIIPKVDDLRILPIVTNTIKKYSANILKKIHPRTDTRKQFTTVANLYSQMVCKVK